MCTAGSCITRNEVGLGINNPTQSKPPNTETFDSADHQDSSLFAFTALGEDIEEWVATERERVSSSSAHQGRKRSAAGAEKRRVRASSWRDSSR